MQQPGGSVGYMLGTELGLVKELYYGAGPANQKVHGTSYINSGRALLKKLRELISLGVQRIIDRSTPAQKDLMKKYGIYAALAKNKITFLDLANLATICPEENIKELIMTGSERLADNQTRMATFSHFHSPHMEIATALRISASIPNFF